MGPIRGAPLGIDGAPIWMLLASIVFVCYCIVHLWPNLLPHGIEVSFFQSTALMSRSNIG